MKICSWIGRENSFYFLLLWECQHASQWLNKSILSIVFNSLHYHCMRVKNDCQRNTGMQVAKLWHSSVATLGKYISSLWVAIILASWFSAVYECKGPECNSRRACVFQIFTGPGNQFKTIERVTKFCINDCAITNSHSKKTVSSDQAALTGSRTQIYCLEGSNANRYTTNATYLFLVFPIFINYFSLPDSFENLMW